MNDLETLPPPSFYVSCIFNTLYCEQRGFRSWTDLCNQKIIGIHTYMYMNICFNTMYVHSYKCIIVYILSKSESVQEMNFPPKIDDG